MTVSYCNRRRSFPSVLLLTLVLCATALFALSCRQVSDLTGATSLEKSDVGKCIKACNEAAHDTEKAEHQIHKVNIFLCQKNPHCLQVENARHDAAIRRLEADRLACIQECHHQGGASGGR